MSNCNTNYLTNQKIPPMCVSRVPFDGIRRVYYNISEFIAIQEKERYEAERIRMDLSLIHI